MQAVLEGLQENDERAAAEELAAHLSDQYWRLNHLYYIMDDSGQVVKFAMNWAQKLVYKTMWFRNVILKARQLGMSTFIQLFMLDTCLFNPNIRAGVIAHSKDDAAYMFTDKIKFAYERLPDWLRRVIPVKRETTEELKFGNNSSIRVSTSMRSGTLQLLHVSEMGKIAKKYPEKAREIVTGSFEAVHPGQMIWVESTAEGQEGKFYDLCMDAMELAQFKDRRLNELDFKFIFLPWWRHPGNVVDATNVAIFPKVNEYLSRLESEMGIKLAGGQRAWYAQKWKSLGSDVYREHPSTAKEAFEQSIEGAYYADELALARFEGRIGKVPHTAGVPVDTWWDLGIDDSTSIWFSQTVGTSLHVIDYYEFHGKGLKHYIEVLEQKSKPPGDGGLGYRYGRHVWPHDGGKRELGTGLTLEEQAGEMGLSVEVAPRGMVDEGIEAVRNILSICWFDEERCEHIIRQDGRDRRFGLSSLESYHKEWDPHLGRWKNNPRHDWASHGADAFRTMAMAHRQIIKPRRRTQAVPGRNIRPQAWT